MKIESQYLQLIREILQNGTPTEDRTGTGTKSIVGASLRHNFRDGFPLLTTKKVHWKSVVGELLWFLSGSSSAKELREVHGVTIWDEWEREDGSLGPVYGHQWRNWDHGDVNIDQLKNVLTELKKNPSSRRLLVNAWNVGKLPEMALPPCHFAWQLIAKNNTLSLVAYQRSCDVFLGLPFNIASYALLLQMIAKTVDMEPGELVWHGGDVHIYNDHHEQCLLQLSREPKEMPTLSILEKKDLFDYGAKDISLVNYDPHPTIKARVSK